jgi:hypothetical protein
LNYNPICLHFDNRRLVFKFNVQTISSTVLVLLVCIALGYHVLDASGTLKPRPPGKIVPHQNLPSQKKAVHHSGEAQTPQPTDRPAVHVNPFSQPSPLSRSLLPVIAPEEIGDINRVIETVAIPFTVVQPIAPRPAESDVSGGAACAPRLDCRIADARKNLVCESLDSAPSNVEKPRVERSEPAGTVHAREGVHLAGFGVAGETKDQPK